MLDNKNSYLRTVAFVEMTINYFFAESECIFRRYFCVNIMPQCQTTVFSIIWLHHICLHLVHLVPKDNTQIAILGLDDLEKNVKTNWYHLLFNDVQRNIEAKGITLTQIPDVWSWTTSSKPLSFMWRSGSLIAVRWWTFISV